MKWFILLLSVLELAYSQTSSCGTIGNPLTGNRNALGRTVSRAQVSAAFYLDTNNSAICAGTVTRWRYCYFPTQSDDAPPRVQFAVYRLNQTGNGYIRVSSVYTASELDDIDTNIDCQILQLNRQNQFAQVQTGDVIGACIFRQSSIASPLEVIGSGSGATGQTLMEGGGCAFNSLPDSTNQLTSRNGLVLLIFADQIFQDMTTTITDGASSTVNPLSTMITNTMVPSVVTSPTMDDSEADLGLRGNSTITETPGSVNLGIVTAIVVVVLLAVTLGAIVMIFVYLLTKHCKKTKTDDDSEANSSAFSNLELSSHAYDFPSLTTSMKIEQQELETSTKEHVYDYAKVHVLERSDYVSMETDMGLDPAYSLLEVSSSRMDYSSHLERNKQEDIYGSVGVYAKPASVKTEIYAQLKSFGIGSIPVENIRVTGHLGSGYFGQVEQGVWINGNEEIDVAMKTLNKQVIRDADQIKFLQEAAIMAQFRHPNIVTLYGITYKQEPMMLVLELVDRGNLKDYLLFLKPTTGEQLMDNLHRLLLKFSQQVALGMQYLSARGYIHRDLAARNVLVNKHGICKITDFGMSRDLAEEDYYVANNRDAIPVKWTAPEALYYKKYSTASDIWSYGCLLYEIWSLGHTPFEELSNREVIRKVSAGRRPAPPPGTPKAIYELMIRCWNPNSSDRPKFREMVLILISEEEDVLVVPPEALSTHTLAGVIGSPLEAGKDMYPELELTYT